MSTTTETTKRSGGWPKKLPNGKGYFFVADAGRDPRTSKRRQVRKRFKTRKEAVAALTELRAQVQKDEFVAPSKVTVREYLTRWCDGLASSATRRSSTVDSYAATIRHHVIEHTGGVQLRALTPVDLDELYAMLLREGRRNRRRGSADRGLSARTVRYVHTVLHRALSDAVDKGLLARNPAANATPPSADAAKAPEAAIWTPGELRSFLHHVREDRLCPLYRLAGMTGMRRGELLGLGWDAVDLDGATVTVRRQLARVTGKGSGREAEFGKPKTQRGYRTIDVDGETVRVLRGWKARQASERLAASHWTDTGLVFTELDGRPLDPGGVSKGFARLVRDSKLPAVRFHACRHSHATHLLAAGRNPREVAERLGHASVAFLLDRYGHVMRGQGAEAAAAVAGLVDGASISSIARR